MTKKLVTKIIFIGRVTSFLIYNLVTKIRVTNICVTKIRVTILYPSFKCSNFFDSVLFLFCSWTFGTAICSLPVPVPRFGTGQEQEQNRNRTDFLFLVCSNGSSTKKFFRFLKIKFFANMNP